MEKNIGRVNAMMRISGGLTLLAWSIAKMAKEEPTGGQMFLAFMGAQKVAEGVTRYCPMTQALGLQKKKEKLKQINMPMQKPITM
ncbi:YgaP family membrane protein [Planococcus sp. FY231025]|uniref:YgaP family membrane protein n=1 Tax=Planococcus sp. FY231025 TaxID=3455699 RepID=UPI003F8F84ED